MSVKDQLEKHLPRIRRVVKLVAKYEDMVDDISQECCVRIIDKENYWKEEPRKLEQWINALARNLTIDFLRKKKREKMKKESVFNEDMTETVEESPFSEDQIEWLVKQFSTLPENKKKILYMRYFKEMKVVDIAAELDVSIPTVSYQLKHTLNILKKRAGLSALIPLLFPWNWNFKNVMELMVMNKFKAVSVAVTLALITFMANETLFSTEVNDQSGNNVKKMIIDNKGPTNNGSKTKETELNDVSAAGVIDNSDKGVSNSIRGRMPPIFNTILPLTRDGSVRGRVYKEDGSPLEGVAVKIGDEKTLSNSEGVFTLENIMKGKVEINLLKEGYDIDFDYDGRNYVVSDFKKFDGDRFLKQELKYKAHNLYGVKINVLMPDGSMADKAGLAIVRMRKPEVAQSRSAEIKYTNIWNKDNKIYFKKGEHYISAQNGHYSSRVSEFFIDESTNLKSLTLQLVHKASIKANIRVSNAKQNDNFINSLEVQLINKSYSDAENLFVEKVEYENMPSYQYNSTTNQHDQNKIFKDGFDRNEVDYYNEVAYYKKLKLIESKFNSEEKKKYGRHEFSFNKEKYYFYRKALIDTLSGNHSLLKVDSKKSEQSFWFNNLDSGSYDVIVKTKTGYVLDRKNVYLGNPDIKTVSLNADNPKETDVLTIVTGERDGSKIYGTSINGKLKINGQEIEQVYSIVDEDSKAIKIMMSDDLKDVISEDSYGSGVLLVKRRDFRQTKKIVLEKNKNKYNLKNVRTGNLKVKLADQNGNPLYKGYYLKLRYEFKSFGMSRNESKDTFSVGGLNYGSYSVEVTDKKHNLLKKQDVLIKSKNNQVTIILNMDDVFKITGFDCERVKYDKLQLYDIQGNKVACGMVLNKSTGNLELSNLDEGRYKLECLIVDYTARKYNFMFMDLNVVFNGEVRLEGNEMNAMKVSVTDKQGKLAKSGFHDGDIILNLNKQNVDYLTFVSVYEKYKDDLNLKVEFTLMRNGEIKIINVPISVLSGNGGGRAQPYYHVNKK